MISVNIYYTGENGNARRFVEEMEKSGIASKIREENGNLGYEYFFPANDEQTVLLIDKWTDQSAIDSHHASPMMAQIARLREKYDLTMKVERFSSEEMPKSDNKFVRTKA